MNTERRAVLDVGTNSVKVLVADVSGTSVSPLLEQSRQTRLGDGLYEQHLLRPDRIAATVAAAAEFHSLALERQARVFRIVATSATREARNRAELLQPLQEAWGVPVEVISGEVEADLAFAGVCTDERYRDVPLAVLEVGGGSTQVLLGHAGKVHYKVSLSLGAVRLLQRCPHSNPPSLAEHKACKAVISELLDERVAREVNSAIRAECSSCQGECIFVGTGGTASVLGGMAAGLESFDRTILDQTCLTLDEVVAHENRLWQSSLESRKQFVGLPPNRADIILYGASIVSSVMRVLGAGPYRVSTRGVRFGAALTARNIAIL